MFLANSVQINLSDNFLENFMSMVENISVFAI